MECRKSIKDAGQVPIYLDDARIALINLEGRYQEQLGPDLKIIRDDIELLDDATKRCDLTGISLMVVDIGRGIESAITRVNALRLKALEEHRAQSAISKLGEIQVAVSRGLKKFMTEKCECAESKDD